MPSVKSIRERLAHRDHRLSNALSRWHPPRLIRLWMIGATRAGDGWLWGGLGLLILLFGGEHRYRVLLAMGLAVLAGICLFSLAKRLTVRPRPCAISPYPWFAKIPKDRFSFPSGHSMTSFAIVVTLSQFYPSYTYALFFCAGSVAASRVLLGMHFLTDVVAGSAMGVGIGYGIYSLIA